MIELPSFEQSWVGVPYIYGGSTKFGIDCSGLAMEWLKTTGEMPLHADMNSQMLFDYYAKGLAEWNTQKPGALMFFGKSAAQITHVAILSTQFLMLEAAGGDSTTTTVEEAIKRNAFVRRRPIVSRNDAFKAILKPRYRALGYI